MFLPHAVQILNHRLKPSHLHHTKYMPSVAFLHNAPHLLDDMHEKDYKSYNATVRNYTASKQHSLAISTFKKLQLSELNPDTFAVAAVIKSSSTFSSPNCGKTLHGFAEKTGMSSNIVIQKAVMDMYARFTLLNDSSQIFYNMGFKDSVCYNVMLVASARVELYDEAMKLFYLMHVSDEEEVEPTSVTIAIVLPIIAKLRSLKNGQSIHSYCIKKGLEAETLVGNVFVSMYAKCGTVMNDACKCFTLIGNKDVISWNSLIAGFCESRCFDEALQTLQEMSLNGFLPNYATIANVLPVCAFVHDGWLYGREIHSYILRSGLVFEQSVSNALLTHYLKVGDFEASELLFKNMHMRDVVTWNTLIAGYALNGLHSKAVEAYRRLIFSGIKPDSVTFVTILPVCAQLQDIDEGRRIHKHISQNSLFFQGTTIKNALISFYGKCKDINTALDIFKEMQNKDLISWNAILNACLESDRWEILQLIFSQMINEKIKPDFITITSILQACAFMGMRKVREAHAYSVRTGLINEQTIGNAVIDSYSKCGSIENALKAFTSLVEKNIITCNTMISGYLKHCFEEEAMQLFNQMNERDLTTWNLMLQFYAGQDRIDMTISLFHELQEQDMKPDAMSIMCMLCACARAASVSTVKQCHAHTIRAQFDDLHLKGTLMDTYSKCGSIKEAYKLFKSSHTKDVVMFTTIIGGFAMHGMAQEANRVFSEMLQMRLKPDHVILTALLSACSHAGLVNEGLKHFQSMTKLYGVTPTMEHYACIVDLFSRKGRLKEAYKFIEDMPCKPNGNIWATLLGSCKNYGETEIGKIAANKLCEVEEVDIGNYVVMSNIYAADGKWDRVEKVRKMMKSKDLKKPAGCSWIEIEKATHVFVASDLVHPDRLVIYDTLACLYQQIKLASYQNQFLL